VRSRICEGLGFLGIELDDQSNGTNGSVISTASSLAVVRVIHTNEELVIAKTVRELLAMDENKENT
jgi:acetate kinase